MQTFSQAVQDARQAAGITQRELARIVGVSAQYVNDIERGRRNPPSERMLRTLADAVSLPYDYLCYLAGRLPSDIPIGIHDQAAVQRAYDALRSLLSAA